MKTTVRNESLLGEAGGALYDFWIHAESIFERSSRHNWEIKQHRHDHFFQIIQIRGGTGEAVVGDDTMRLERDMLLFIPEKVNHGFRFSRDIDGHVITIVSDRLPTSMDDADRVRRFVSKPRLLRLAEGDAETGFLATTFDRLEAELALGFGARNGLVEAYLTVVLSLAAGKVMTVIDDELSSGRDLARIAHLNRLIGRHYREHLPVEFYARELGVSVTHLNRITKALTGRTMNELLSDKIIAQARLDLIFTPLTAQEIAHALGFADPAYFTRFFAREAGETPRQFRERERGRHLRTKAAAE